MKQRRVVVTGIGTINPLGNNVEEYFSNLEKGVSGAGPITHFDPSNFKTKFACELKGYDPSNFFDRKELRKYDLYTQYALVAAEQAIQDSGLDLETVDKDMTGVIWASIPSSDGVLTNLILMLSLLMVRYPVSSIAFWRAGLQSFRGGFEENFLSPRTGRPTSRKRPAGGCPL